MLMWQVVPRGTNGGVSGVGTAAGCVGGALVGLVFWVAARSDSDPMLPSPGFSSRVRPRILGCLAN